MTQIPTFLFPPAEPTTPTADIPNHWRRLGWDMISFASGDTRRRGQAGSAPARRHLDLLRVEVDHHVDLPIVGGAAVARSVERLREGAA